MLHLFFINPAQCFIEYNRIYVMFILVTVGLIYKIRELSELFHAITWYLVLHTILPIMTTLAIMENILFPADLWT